MPTSRPYHLSWLCEKVLELKPKSILDIGIGFGSKGVLFREYTDVWNGDMFSHKTKIDGVEIYDKYVTELQQNIYDNIFIGDITEIVDTLDNYDLIYMGDVIEHITKEKGIKLIHKLKQKCKNLIIVTPYNVSKQDDVYGNENERHISEWRPIDFGNGIRTLSFGNTQVINWRKPGVYYCQGMNFYGEGLLKLGFNEYSPNESALFLGLYFDNDYQVYKDHIGAKYVFWNGSDVLRLINSPERIQILKDYPALHICHNKQLQSELKSVGIDAKIEPIFFANINDYSISYEYKDHLEVYINAHPGRESEYGVDILLQVAEKLSDVKFFVYGVNGQDTGNVHYMGWIDEAEADSKMSKHHICLRLNEHDGLSQLIIKAGLWGHYVLTIQYIKNTIKIDSIDGIIKKIEALKSTTEPCLELRNSILSMGLNEFSWL